MRTALSVLLAATCIPVIALGSTISGGSGGNISLQLEPYDRGSRDVVRPVRAQGAAGGDVAFDPPSAAAPSSPMVTCATATGVRNSNGACGNYLPVTGDPGTEDFPPNPNDWEDDSAEEIVSDAAASSLDGSDLPGEPDAGALGSPGEIGGGSDLAEAPEPSTILLMAGSLVALGYFRPTRNT